MKYPSGNWLPVGRALLHWPLVAAARFSSGRTPQHQQWVSVAVSAAAAVAGAAVFLGASPRRPRSFIKAGGARAAPVRVAWATSAAGPASRTAHVQCRPATHRDATRRPATRPHTDDRRPTRAEGYALSDYHTRLIQTRLPAAAAEAACVRTRERHVCRAPSVRMAEDTSSAAEAQTPLRAESVEERYLRIWNHGE
ncbi:uncharacterized protein LOC126260681 [Schistocerca nitens]|uniref:uncharacterized protein LOC126260681 n=1 Tax=Schistocerca nitens TaxID=7011 RepID=UPI002118A511|nr:uncharacterized protein LOC126260681 [Schistocerca nitens]